MLNSCLKRRFFLYKNKFQQSCWFGQKFRGLSEVTEEVASWPASLPDKAAEQPEEGQLPVDELKVLASPRQQVPALQLLGYKPAPSNSVEGLAYSAVLSL